MSRHRLTRQARNDLTEIAEYIAKDNPRAATKLIRSIRRTCREVIARYPEVGHSCPELAPGLRHFPAGNYLIFYRGENPVQILRVIHGARDIEALFESGE